MDSKGRELTMLIRRAILASFLLNEKLGRLGVCGCACCLVSQSHEANIGCWGTQNAVHVGRTFSLDGAAKSQGNFPACRPHAYETIIAKLSPHRSDP